MSKRMVIIWSALGFLSLGGGFGVGAYLVLRPVPPPAFAPKPEEAAPEEKGMLVYVPLEDQLAVAVAEQPVRVMLTLGVSVRGSLEELVVLQEAVKTKKAAVMAALLVAAQAEVVKGAEPAVLLERLPAPLRDAVNGVIGTAELPEPVEEVLITGLVTQ
ncbi:hypothetical protein [Paragemmobacter straminiformis]|uniref:Flagellar protein FliL n=1 Tax=Paragemmobacter straminiformis TaxID=2045119 RepID=A0A842I563_9RHOB|nr:hypothetical protein [Gemmobacter straminiformis]MBC2834796.1 hypothetical protein [Gemmobacter straminiformis]